MARNYTQATVKTLFGEASGCAYPGCGEPLIFRDRGKATAIAEIAHIRSESPDGPRHDPGYTGDVNGPENLLLLCGKHHRPVDRHESIYTVEELLTWKVAQQATAGAGTPLSDADLRSYQRLGDEERQSLRDIARLAQRVVSVCGSVQDEVDALRAAAEQERRKRAASFGPMWAVDEDGNQSPIDTLGTLQLSMVERREWQAKEQTVWEAKRPRVQEALGALEEEVAVLRMFDAALAPAGDEVTLSAAVVARQVGDGAALRQATQALNTRVSHLWRLANGEAEPV